MNKGQGSFEFLLVLGVVLIFVSGMYVRGQRSNESDVAVSSARLGVQEAITKLSTKYGDGIDIVRWDMKGRDITFFLSVDGYPPPEDNRIENLAKKAANKQLISSVGSNYTVDVEVIERWSQ